MKRSAINNNQNAGHAMVENNIARLCSSQLGLRLLLPSLFVELEKIVPSSGRCFFWVDEQRGVTGAYDDRPEADRYLPLFIEEFMNKPGQQEIMLDWTESQVKFGKTVDIWRLIHVGRKCFEDSGLYNEVLKPLGAYRGLHTSIYDSRGRIGVLIQNRAEGEAPFDAAEMAVMDRLMPFIAHAHRQEQCPDHETAWDRSAADAVLLLNQDLSIQHLSASARVTLRQLHDGYQIDSVRSELPPVVQKVARRLLALDKNPSQWVQPPSMVHTNPWGRFTVRAEWLSRADGVILMVMHQLQPLRLGLSKRLSTLALTPRQHEAALLMVEGRTDSEISERMGIKRTTAVTHVRAVLQQCGLGSRNELAYHLLSMA